MAEISKIQPFGSTTQYDLRDPSKLPLAGGTMTGRLTAAKGFSNLLTGSGTAGKDTGSGDNRYQPARWTFNAGVTVADGDVFTIKIPVAGHDYGVFMSVNGGGNYYPVVLNGTGRVTTHYPSGNYIQVVFESGGSAASMFPLAGGTSRTTISGGVFRVFNYYDSGAPYWPVRTENGRFYAGATGVNPYSLVCLDSANKFSMLVANSTNAGTGTSKTMNTSGKFKLPAVILYYNANNTTAANALVSSTYATYWVHYAVDIRYSHNHTVTFTTNSPCYIECTVDSNGYWSPTATGITQTLTSGRYYIYLGQTYSTEYQISLAPEHPCYYYDGTNLTDYTRQTIASWKAASANYAANANTAAHAVHAGSAAYTATASGAVTAAHTVTAGRAIYAASAGYITTAANAVTAGRTIYAASAGYIATAANAVTAGRAIYAASAGYITTAANAVTAGRAIYATSAGYITTAQNAVTAGNAVTANKTVKSLKLANNRSFNGSADVTLLTDDLTPAISKTYTNNAFYSTNDSWDNSTWYFMSVKPVGWYQTWRVRFKVRSYSPSYTNEDSTTWCEIFGRNTGITSYKCYNEFYDRGHYYIAAYPLKQAGYNAGYGVAIGISIRYANNYNNSAHYRTFIIDYYDSDGCTVTMADSLVKWASWPGTGTTNYGSLWTADAYNRGLRETGDDNSYDLLQMSNNYVINGATFRMPGNSLLGFDREGKAQCISLYSADYTGTTTSINTARVYNAAGFDWTRGLFYHTSGSNFAKSANLAVHLRSAASAIDLRYTDNCVASSSANTLGMVSYKPVYLRGVIKNDGLFYVAPIDVTYNSTTYKRAWTQDIPTSVQTDGTYQYVYLFMGYPYYNGSYVNSQYQLNLAENNPLYWYQNGRFEEYEQSSSYALNADKIDGLHSTAFLRQYYRNDDLTSTDNMSTTNYLFSVGDTGGWPSTATKPSGVDNAFTILHSHQHSGNYFFQLGLGGTTDKLYYRSAYNSTTWKDWRTVLSSSNYTDYTVTKTGSGASGTWGISITGSAGSVAWGNVTGRPTVSSPSASGTDISFIDTISQSNGAISATRKTVRDASASQSGIVSTSDQTFKGNKTIIGGLEIKGHIAGDSGTTGHGLYSGGGYHSSYNNIILHGSASTGSSGIAFVSDKVSSDGTITTINQPSDRAFIQYHSYGITTYTAEGTAPTLATSGEANKLIIGVGNDSNDEIRLQTPSRTGLLHQVGTAGYVIPDTNNTTGTVGSSTVPVYVNAGVITQCSTTLGVSITGNAATASSVAWSGITGKPNRAGSDSDGGPAQTVKGAYTANGGQQNPNYFGKNKVGFLMMNTTVNNNSHYKDWIIMDCYSGSDVGGGVAFGVNRQALGAYIMRSAAARETWAESAELLGTHNYTSYTVEKDGTGATGTWSISITGNAATATKLSNTPNNTTTFLRGDNTWSNTLTDNFNALKMGITNTDSTKGYGLSLYNGAVNGAPTYGIMFAGTGTFGTHGAVTSDWATYLTMSDTTNRGWIFRRGSTNVASIDGTGKLYLGTSTSTSEPGLYWNPYVESASDGSDVSKIYQIKSGVAGGTELRISQANDSGDVINICSPYYIYLNSKRAFAINDSWLRINEDSGFSSGVYFGSGTGGLVRTDNQFQVGNKGANFYANSSGNGYFSNNLTVGNHLYNGRNDLFYNNSAPGQGDLPLTAWGVIHGYPIYTDPTFLTGTNSVSIYNNSGGGTVTHTRDTYSNLSQTNPGTGSNYIIKITTNGTASPGAGGFVQSISSRANAIFVQIFRALVPTGYSVNTASNSMGASYQDQWLTSNAGTGKWEWYARRVICGKGGTFSSGGHVYVSGSSNTSVTWYLASCNVYDVTKTNYDGLRTRYADETTGNAATATKLSNTPNNTTTFLRGDNTWSNTLTGDIKLYAASGNSPSLIFHRGENNNLTDWRIFVTEGKLSFQSAADATTWTERAYFKDNSGNFVANSFTGNLTGNVTGNVTGSSGSCTGNAATATKLSNTPNNTTTFLRGDNTFTNILTGTFELNGDLNLYTSSADGPDIVWWYANKGKEQARIWMGSGEDTKWAPHYRCYKSDGTSLYNGRLVLGDGTGASGTWGINITGNAANVTGTVAVANGGTGNASQTANRLVWSESASKLTAGNHYANATKVAINSTSAPTENLYIGGTVKASSGATFKTLTLSSTAGENHINFSRTSSSGPNYINVPSDSALGVSVGGAGGANITLTIDKDSIRPWVDLTRTIGTASCRWKTAYIGAFTIGNGANDSIESKTMSSNSTFYINRKTSNSIIFQDAGTNKIRIDTSNNLRPETTNTLSVGTSSYKWANMYATTFHGALDGNASSATLASFVGKGSHTSAVTANEFTPSVGSLTLVGNVSNTTMPHQNNANAEMVIKAHGTSSSNYYEARMGFSSNGSLYYMPVNNTSDWKKVSYTNNLITGTGTAAVDNGSGDNRYVPAKWTFSTGANATNGEIFTIKIPVAGHSYGVFMSVNNGTNYYPVVADSGLTGRLTTHYPVNQYIQVIFDSSGSAASMFPLAGGTARVTVTGGVFRVINYYDSNTNTLLRTYSSATNINVPLIGSSSANSTTAAWSTYSGTYKDWYGVIPNDDSKRAKINLSTGALTVPGGITANLTGTASKATADANGNNIASTYAKKSELLDLVYPVGAIYISVVNTSPATLFGGTWEQIKDKFILSAGDTYTAGSTGGSATTTLTEAQIPSHTHTLSDHYHYVPPQNGWTSTNGYHGHAQGDWVYASSYQFKQHNVNRGINVSGTANYNIASVTNWKQRGWVVDSEVDVHGNGDHSHSVGTNAVNSGGPSNNTSGATGSSGSHDNMPPYLTVYMWKRTA